ncbi:hypothetical protein SLE2022_146890 [Rubroshorea leprosula]
MASPSQMDIEQKQMEDFGPWLLVEHRKPRRRTTVPAPSSEKTSSRNKPSTSRKVGAPTRKLGPKPASGSESSHSKQFNDNIVSAFNAEQDPNQFRPTFSTARPSQSMGNNGQKAKNLRWVSKKMSQDQDPNKEQGPSEPKEKQLTQRPVSTLAQSPTLIKSTPSGNPITSDPSLSFSPDNSIVEKSAPPHLTPPFQSTPVTSPNLSQVTHGPSQFSLPSPKPPDLPSERTPPNLPEICTTTNVGGCLTTRRELDNATNNSGLEGSDNNLQAGGYTGSIASHPTSHSFSESVGALSDSGSRVFRRRAQHRRGTKPYNPPNSDQFSLHASLDGHQLSGANGASSSGDQNSALIIHEHRDGLRSTSAPLSFSSSEILIQGSDLLTANTGSNASPDTTGSIQPL